jgi:hypothetical protein
MLIVTAAVCIVAGSAAPVYAQDPQHCTVYIEVGPTGIMEVTNRKTTCNFDGKVKFLVSNNADVDYKLRVHDFKARTDGDCTKPQTGAAVAMPITKANKMELHMAVPANDEDKAKFTIKGLGGASNECYKFDVTLYDEDWKYLSTLDPDLEITEPMGPPPKPPAKKNP